MAYNIFPAPRWGLCPGSVLLYVDKPPAEVNRPAKQSDPVAALPRIIFRKVKHCRSFELFVSHSALPLYLYVYHSVLPDNHQSKRYQ